MTTTSPTLQWSEREPRIPVPTVAELDRALDRVAAQCSPDRPTIVVIHVNGYELTLGLGSTQSFVQLAQSQEPQTEPYLVTVGDGRAQGEVAFYFLGEHHTEVQRRHIISTSTARDVAREFFNTGRRSPVISWEKV